MPHPKRDGPVWDERARAQRKRGTIRIKNQMREHAPQLGGMFTTHDVINGNSWADIYFLSLAHKLRVYNGTIDTGLYAYASRCESLAWSASERLLPLRDFVDDEMFVRTEDGYWTLAPTPQRTIDAEHAAFGGLTRSEWMDKERERLADSGDVWVHPRVHLDFSYRFGVGLLATLPDDALQLDNIDAFVADFLARGELPYELATIKLSYPSSRLKEASSVNSIGIDPKDWATPEQEALAGALSLSREERVELDGSLVKDPPAPKRSPSL